MKIISYFKSLEAKLYRMSFNFGFETKDILLFFQASGKKADNDKNNGIRESILEKILSLDSSFYSDSENEKYWNLVKNSWNETLRSLCSQSFDSIDIKKKGGRANNYDFLIKYKKGKKVLKEIKAEFKHNSDTIKDTPQFLSLYEGGYNLFEETYSSFYYDNYLKKYLECDEKLKEYTEDMISKKDYLKYVKTTKYDCHKLFKSMYERDKECKSEKDKVVNDSIKEYLELHGSKINISKVCEKLKVSQGNKIFLLWNLDSFSVEEMSSDLMNPEKMKFHSIKRNNCIILEQEKTQYHLLLRWKNHKGILLPAWQISMK